MSFYYKFDAFDKVDGRIAKNLNVLNEALKVIPQRTIDQTLIIGTWNIREFDSNAYGLRGKEPLHYIAEIISRFDIVALQEVKRDTRPLVAVMKLLGSWWKYIITDVVEGEQGNDERMAFVYDSRKVEFGGLAGEILIPPIEDSMGRTIAPSRQLHRTPFISGFKAGWFKFMLCTVHIVYGKEGANSEDRKNEIGALANFLGRRATDKFSWARNLIVLGDFNIFRPNDIAMQAVTNQGFVIPENLQQLPSNVAQNKFYDQIAFYTPDIAKQLSNVKAGVFNFFDYIYKDSDMEEYIEDMGDQFYLNADNTPRLESSRVNFYKTYWRTHQMSDHLPMWAELKIDFGKDYLEWIIQNQLSSTHQK